MSWPEPTPIRVRNLHRWWLRTRRVDDETYRKTGRGVSLSRALLGLVPLVRRPLFVIGAPRSGTTFLGDAIASLPEFSYHFEPPLTKAAIRYVYEGLWSERRARFFFRAVYGWLLARHADGDLRLAEKTPQNCFIASFLARTFPDASFLHIVRDGRDAALSYRKRGWLNAEAARKRRRESGGYPVGPYARYWIEPERRREFEETTDYHRCIWAWRRHVEAALAAERELSSRVMRVRYEELVSSPQETGARILEFCRIRGERSRAILAEALGKADDRSVGRFATELTPDERETTEKEAGSLLRELGYTMTTAEPEAC